MNRILSSKQLGRVLSPSTTLIQGETKPVLLSKDIITRSIHMANSRLLKLAAISGSAAAISGAYFGYVNYQRYNSIRPASGVHLKEDTMQLTKMPDIKPTYRVQGPTKLNFDITLFQYCSCPFCCKTRTFLDFFGVSYDVVEVNPVLRQQLKWSEGYKKVPILLAHTGVNTEDNKQASEVQKVYQINDSSVIVSTLGSCLLSKRTIDSGKKAKYERNIDYLGKILVNYQTIEVEDEEGNKKKDIPNRYFLMLGDIDSTELEKRETNLAEERRWRDWTDRVLVHSLSPNIYRTMPEALQAFNNFSTMGNWDKHFSTFERMTAIYAGSAAMWLIGRRLKKKYNLKEDVRESLYDNCRLWLKAIGKERQFMGGDKPNLADLSVYGVLSSIEGCVAFNDLMNNTNVGPWYMAVKDACQSHAGNQLVQSI